MNRLDKEKRRRLLVDDDDYDLDDIITDVNDEISISEILKGIGGKLKNNAKWNNFKYISSTAIFGLLACASFASIISTLCNPTFILVAIAKVILGGLVFAGSLFMTIKSSHHKIVLGAKKSKAEKRRKRKEKKELRKKKRQLKKALKKEKNDRPNISLDDLEIKDENVDDDITMAADNSADDENVDLDKLGEAIIKNTEKDISEQENNEQVNDKADTYPNFVIAGSKDNANDGPNINLDELQEDVVYQNSDSKNGNNTVNNDINAEDILKIKLFRGFKKAVIETSNVSFVPGIGVYIYPIMKTDKNDITFFEAGYKAVYGEVPTSVETEKHKVYMVKQL